ncbi:hypothetical protein BSL78_20013 [Apostichopus japonicus]|uniref:Arf-GAP with Rho-GAP domain, ANK repeat and PH domain-containing protein 1 n=1 Tax=Stichopus japonicus TaxID=307972 RepID=A0A2G8K543_STIJA|nr:hypothetical protein BSL78_20013 [Apostichopus japonicus]
MATTSEEPTNLKFVTSQIKALRLLPGNKQCADCQECLCPQCSMKEPHWISEELEIIVCSECKSIHEGVTETTFRSLQVASEWTAESIQLIGVEFLTYSKVDLFEQFVNYIHDILCAACDISAQLHTRHFEPSDGKSNISQTTVILTFAIRVNCHQLSGSPQDVSLRFREHWIKSKYIKKLFKQRGNPPRYLWGTKTGYLWKRGRDDSLFMRRWFVLDVENTPILKYYSDANEENLKGEIPLMSLDLCLTRETKMENPNAMQIFCPEDRNTTRVIYLYSDTPKELVEWYQTIRIRKYHQICKRMPDLSISMVLQRLGNDILHEGHLSKTGKKGTETYRKRWFVLHGRKLHYFKEALDANPKGTISLDGEGISVILTGQRDRLGFHFKLKTPERIYPLIAEDEQQRELWIKAIHQSCYQDQILASRLADKASTLPIRLNRDPTEPTPTRSNTTPAPSHVTPKVQEESNSDSDSMEELVSGLNYVYLQNGSILANETWDAEHGLMVKGEVLMLKISPGGLTFESDSSDITVTVQKVDLIDISRSQEFGDVSLMVKCSGSPAPPVVSLPMRIELYHCAILSSKENVKPVLWFNKDSTWSRLTIEEDDKISCEVLEHTYCISTKYFGSLAASLEGESVLGKRMRCAAFCKFEENSENLDVIVYIFNNHVSEFMWKMINVNEVSNNHSTLLDISNEFSLLKENKDLTLSIETIQGLQLMPGNFTSLKIPFAEVWSKSFVSYHIELIQTGKVGLCKIIVAQEQPVNGNSSAVLNLKNTSELDFGSRAVGKLERQLTPHAIAVAPPVPDRLPEGTAPTLSS